MPKMTISLYGRDYHVACATGQENRVRQIAALVDRKMHEVAANAGNTTEQRLFMLACMTMADELMELRDKDRAIRLEEEDTLIGAIAQMHDRVANLVYTGGQA
mgnify:CR=1 FL=1